MRLADDDGSVAWCIVLSCFLVNVIVMGFLKCLGILIIELMKAFKATPTDVSVLVSITACLNCVAGPLACYLVMRFTARAIAFTGTVLVSLGLMLSWFATSITFLYVTIGVLVGFGSGLTYSPGVILIGNYFQKNRGMANGMVVSGSPVGGMIMPYMLNFLVKYLGCRGALLILGGLMMNAVVCTLSYRPYRKTEGSGQRISLKKKKSQEISLEARRTEGSVHIPQGGDDFKTGHFNTAEESDSNSSSDDSSGPEIVSVETPSRKSQSGLGNNAQTASTGSVIVYKINEKYGKLDTCLKRRHKKKSNSSKNKENPSPWDLPLLPKDPVAGVTSDRNRCKSVFLSGTGQNIESKQSQTKIHTRQTGETGSGQTKDNDEKVIAHPFAANQKIRQGKLKSNLKKNNDISGNHPPMNYFNTVDPSSGLLQLQSSSNARGGGSSVDSTLRNRRNYREVGKLREPTRPKSTMKKVSPYILSLDHSCVIMWSNDDVAKDVHHPNLRGVKGSTSGSGQNVDRVEDEEPIDQFTYSQEAPLKKGCCTRILNWIRNSPLKNRTFLILLFSNATTAIATTNILLLIPGLGEYRALSKSEYSSVYLIISVTDLCARLLGAYISDKGFLASQTLFACGLVFAGISSVFIAFSDSFIKFCVSCSTFGLAMGFHIGIFGTLLAEIVGVESLAVGYALCMILNGFIQFSFIYISGRVLSFNRDAFSILYVFYGVVLLFGGLLWLIPFIFFRNSNHHKSMEGSENADLNIKGAFNASRKTSERSSKVLKARRSGNSKKTEVAMSNLSLY